jgi:hypothetical protein
MIGITALQRFGFGALKAIPASMALLLFWCLLSAFWAPESGIVLRRAGLEIIVVASLMLGVASVGPERAFTLWRWLLAFVLLVNFVSIPLIGAARHAAGEIDPALVGNWRGLYGHKNIAGAVCAITVILFLFTRNGWKNWMGIAIALAACVFLYFTHSKSSAGFLPIALFCGVMYRIGWRDGLSRAILTALAGLLLCGALAFILLDADTLTRMLEDPREFTGRSAIWWPSCAISPTIRCWAPASAPSPTPGPSRRCTIMSAAAGWMPSAMAITAICRCSSPSAASALRFWCWR